MILRVKQFFWGCLFGFVATYVVLVTLFCSYYGFSGMVGVALVSMLIYFTPFPYMFYFAGGLIFLFIPAQRFPHIHRQLWKWLLMASVVAVFLIFFSEIAHQFGWLNTEFHLPRKAED